MPIKVLAIFSAPRGLERLNIRDEKDKLIGALKKSKFGYLFEVTAELHITLAKFKELLNENYQLIHFSGHSNQYNITFEKLNGNRHPIPLSAFIKLIQKKVKTTCNQLKCIILNSCYSTKLGEELSKLGICTISMKDEIKEEAAKLFTEGFYSEFNKDYTILDMFENGKNNIHLESHRNWNVPELKGEGKINFEIINIPKIPPELEFCIEDERDSDFERITEVYIQPYKYENALKILQQNKFIIITGPPNVGKTATAYNLANTIKRENKEIDLIFSIKNEHIKNLKQLKNSILIFDDVFGEVKFDNELQANEFIEYQKLRKENNYIIYTSREEILLKAKTSRTKFAEIPQLDDNTFTIEQEGFYNDNALEKILNNHIRYYIKQNDITEHENEIAQNNLSKIIKNLRFPHNYKELVEIELSKVSENEIDIDKAIDNAKYIKKAVRSWFLNIKDKSIKYFIFTLALFHNLIKDRQVFDEIYGNVIKILKKKYSDLDVVKIEYMLDNALISIYVHEKGGFIDFIHPHYWEGVINGILKSFTEDINSIQPILRDLMYNNNDYIRHSIATNFGEIGREMPKLILPLLEEMMNDENLAVRLSVAKSLGEIGEVESELVLPLLKKMFGKENPLIRYSIAMNLIEIVKIRPELAMPYLKDMVLGVQDSKMYSQLPLYIAEIGKIKTDLVLPLLKKLIFDNDDKIRLFVARTLKIIGRIRPDQIFPLLKIMKNDVHSEIRSTIVDSYSEMSKLRPNLVVPLLKEMTNDDEYWIRKKAFEKLEKMSRNLPKLIIPILNDMVNEGNSLIPGNFPYNLMRENKIKIELIILLLEDIENDNRSGIEYSIAKIIGEISVLKSETVIPLLKEMEKDQYLIGGKSITNHLNTIGRKRPELVIPLLTEMIKYENPQIRFFVVDNLINLGKIEELKILPLIKALAKDEFYKIRRAIAKNLSYNLQLSPDLIVEVSEIMKLDNSVEVKRYLAYSLCDIWREKPEKIITILEYLQKTLSHELHFVSRIAEIKKEFLSIGIKKEV
ncbi:MAG: HEAT repeat domain-containing protein [Promethearchaeota archaeon]